jgi:glycosyltransferase involved in cell wall biosynthesis
MTKLSIIVPIYNVEKYLQNCLSNISEIISLTAEIEFILINDGSTDNSGKILNEWYLPRNNLLIFNQNNSGLSLTRNKGINNSTGRYIGFLDSDDTLEVTLLLKLLQILDKNGPEIISFCRNKIKLNESPKQQKIYSEFYKSYTGIEYLLNQNFEIPSQLYFYKKNFIKKYNLFFEPHIFHEDNLFTLSALYHANSVLITNTFLYNHFERSDSITGSVNPKRCFDLIRINELQQKFISNNNMYPSKQLPFLINAFFALSSTTKLYLFLKNTKEKRNIKTLLVKKKKFVLANFLKFPLKLQIESILYLIYPPLLGLILNLLKKK